MMYATDEAVITQTHRTDVQFLIYWESAPSEGGGLWPCPVHWLGAVRDDRVLALAYSSADVMVVPSRQNNLPNTTVEAQACGTPVVAFDIGGLPDILEHQHTGYLAKAFDTEDLAQGILWVLAQGKSTRLGVQARKQAVARFSYPVVAEQYVELYAGLLEGWSAKF